MCQILKYRLNTVPVKGISTVRKNMKAKFDHINKVVTPEVMMQVLIIGASNAARITPVDQTNLINSQFRKIERTSLYGIRGTVGYTANYALYVHEMVEKNRGKPRTGKGSSGAYWGPHGEREFLRLGFERDGLDAIKQVIREGYRV